MQCFLALYRGNEIENARLIAVSANPLVCADFARVLLTKPDNHQDPAIAQVEQGRKVALRIIASEGVRSERK